MMKWFENWKKKRNKKKKEIEKQKKQDREIEELYNRIRPLMYSMICADLERMEKEKKLEKWNIK